MSFGSPIAFEFLPYYNRSSLLVPAKLNSSFWAVSLKGFGWNVSCSSVWKLPKSKLQTPKFVSVVGNGSSDCFLPVHETSAFTIWHSVGLRLVGEGRLISLRGFITFDTLNVWFCLPCSHSFTACTLRYAAKIFKPFRFNSHLLFSIETLRISHWYLLFLEVLPGLNFWTQQWKLQNGKLIYKLPLNPVTRLKCTEYSQALY